MKLDSALLQAYHETDYWCAGLDDQGAIVLRIGQPQPQLNVLYAVFKVDCAAFITACNPLSQQLTEAENHLRQQRLLADLKQLGFTGLRGEGRPLRPGWQPEASWLVPGMTLALACQMGERYQQHALVWVGADCTPTLQVLTKPADAQNG